MVNFVSHDGHKYSILFSRSSATVGRGQFRECVRCEILTEGGYVLSTGVSLCHPSDQFNARKGSHLALKHAMCGIFDPKDAASAHKKIDGWFN